ncbi:Uncharacterised protein [Mycobacteroides abscessus subsp. massiliense]|uniref:hypothetical protein n=1 Tax=Mycobacteroides abscessus TaxID=36809 RepID=UPI0009A90914|nr:hypothetical protein [Mycobacteroides abscessus]SKY52404.1 Uncharacterised protein [Mycobacteroides abscessus subsp. massiliense]SKZ09195.1 Uncharacterised protein [Mycobacteroides abscessus subsp. massiliense]
MSQPEPKRTRRSIVREWLSEETFWRDVTTRTLAAAIVATGAYLFALGAGYVSTPSGASAVKGIATVALGLLIGALTIYYQAFYRPEHWRNRPLWVRRSEKVFQILFAIFIGLMLIDTMAHPLPFWPYNTELFTIHFKDGRTF